jgi:hypothetical protein
LEKWIHEDSPGTVHRWLYAAEEISDRTSWNGRSENSRRGVYRAVMQHIISIIAAASALTVPQTSIVTKPPVAVSTCTVSDLYGPAMGAEFGSAFAHSLLQLTFVNTDDAVATQVTFDVKHDGAHTVVMDRGRFSTGVAIEHFFDDDFGSGYDRAADACAVVAITFADGRRWTAPESGAATASAFPNR